MYCEELIDQVMSPSYQENGSNQRQNLAVTVLVVLNSLMKHAEYGLDCLSCAEFAQQRSPLIGQITSASHRLAEYRTVLYTQNNALASWYEFVDFRAKTRGSSVRLRVPLARVGRLYVS